MIKTVTIDIIDDKAMKHLEDLELLKLIRMRKEKQSSTVSWPESYKGTMSKESLSDVGEQLDELRNGWE